MDKKQQAIELRKQGYSLLNISKLVGISKSSVSLWTRDIKLTKEQEESLKVRPSLKDGREKLSVKRRAEKEQWQHEGMLKAKELKPLHILGCAIYWGEGSKTHNDCSLVNSDPNMLRCFINFVYNELHIDCHDLKIHINCYDDMHTVEEIEQFWLKELNLSKTNLYKTTVNSRPSSSKEKASKLEYGTCSVRLTKGTKHLEHIKGAISYYGNLFREPVEN